MEKIKKKNKLVRIIFSALLIFSLIIPLSASYAGFLGSAMGVPSSTDSMNSIMSDLGMDKGAVKNGVASFNVGEQKKQAPQVTLNFANPNPLPDEQVSVEATPMYFGNDLKSLYYTWYIKHADDNSHDPDPWKIEAAKIIASNDFDWKRAQDNGAYSPGSPQDSDGYTAIYGGDDQRNKTDNDGQDPVNHPLCYIHDFNTGKDYSIDCHHYFPDAPGYQTAALTGKDANQFGRDEELFWHTDPINADTSGSGQSDEATVAGLGKNTFTWNYQTGDKVGVIVEGISFEATQAKDSSYKVMWALPRNSCHPEDYVDNNDLPDSTHLPQTTNIAGTPAVQQVRACLTAPIDDTVTTLPVDNCSGGALSTETWLDANGYGTAGAGAGWPTDVIRIGGTASTDIGSGLTVSANSITLTSRTDGVSHLAGAEVLGNAITTTTNTERVMTDDPYNNQVEITDTPTGTITIVDQNTDSLFSYSNLDDSTTTYQKRSFDMQSSDLNECLEHNLMSPAEGSAQEKIKVNLTATPDSPMNDPSGINSDYLEVTALLENVTDASYLQYDWEVYQSNEANPADWGTQIPKSQLLESTQTSGLGVKSLKFKLAFDSSPSYLKVRLRVTENASGSTRGGSGSLVIPLSSTQDKISVYSTMIDPNNPDYFAIDTANEICRNNQATDQAEAQRNAICPVLKNEVIGLRYAGATAGTQFQWKLNGATLKYDTCFFQGCSDSSSQGGDAYFPVIDDAGKIYTIELAIVTSSGEKRNLIRTFQVDNPSVKIFSPDQYAQALLLGNYIGLNGEEYPDYSETDYQAVPGTTVNLNAKRLPFSFAIDNDKTQWFVDGQQTAITGTNISFPVNKPIGGIYTVSFNTLYTQSTEKKRLLYEYWGVRPDQFYEVQLTGTVDVTMVPSLPGVVVAGKTKSPTDKVLAAIFSGAPAYISFLLRIVLVTLLLLSGSRIIFSLFPVQNKSVE